MNWDEAWHDPAAVARERKMHGIGFTWTHEWDDTRGAAVARMIIQVDGSVTLSE